MLRETGIVRNLDALGRLGRIVIPKEIRKSMYIREGDPIEIYVDGESIILEKVELQCVCCGFNEENKLVEKNGVHICPQCVEDLKREVEWKD